MSQYPQPTEDTRFASVLGTDPISGEPTRAALSAGRRNTGWLHDEFLPGNGANTLAYASHVWRLYLQAHAIRVASRMVGALDSDPDGTEYLGDGLADNVPIQAAIDSTMDTHGITGVVAGAGGTLTIAGDRVDDFHVGRTFHVEGSTGNDGAYVVTGVALAAGDTVLTVANVPDATVDGDVMLYRGGVVQLSEGLFTLTAGIVLRRNVTLRGAGKRRTVLRVAGASEVGGDAADFIVISASSTDHVGVECLTVDGNGGDLAIHGNDGIEFSTVDAGVLREVEVFRCHSIGAPGAEGIGVRVSSTCTGIVLDDVAAEDCDTYGLLIGGSGHRARGLSAIGCDYEGCSWSADASDLDGYFSSGCAGGIQIDATESTFRHMRTTAAVAPLPHGIVISGAAARCDFSDCWSYANDGHGFYDTSSVGEHTFARCRATDNLDGGFVSDDGGRNHYVTCTASGNTADGFEQAAGSDGLNSWVDCLAKDNGVNGWLLTAGTKNRLVNCRAEGNAAWGVKSYGAKTTFTGCVAEGNGEEGVLLSTGAEQKWLGGRIDENDKGGIWLHQSDESEVRDCHLTDNGQTGADAYDAIVVEDADQCGVVGNTLSQHGAGIRYGVNLLTTAQNVKFYGNQIAAGATGAYNVGGVATTFSMGIDVAVANLTWW